jgi:hypothetical protein
MNYSNIWELDIVSHKDIVLEGYNVFLDTLNKFFFAKTTLGSINTCILRHHSKYPPSGHFE